MESQTKQGGCMIELQNGIQILEEQIVQTATASVDSLASTSKMKLMQYDDTLPIGAVTLTRKAKAWIPPGDATFRVRMGKPDGHGVFNDALGIDEKGVVYFVFTHQMTAAYGIGQISIEIDAGGKIKASAPFEVEICKNPVQDDEIQSGDEALSLTQVVDSVRDAVAQAQQYAVQAGETPTELADARNGYDGTTYASTGEAIRGQARQLHQDKEDAFRNLITADAFASGKNNFCTSETLEDGMLQITSSATYGRYDVSLKFPKVLQADQVICFLARVFVPDKPKVAFGIRPLLYAYSATENIGEVAPFQEGELQTISQAGTYDVIGFYRPGREDVIRLDVGVLMNKVGAKIGIYAYNLFLTSESDFQLYQDLNLFDFLDEQGYVDRVDHLVSHKSERAVTSQTAQSAYLARYADNADLRALGDFDVSKATGFSTTIAQKEENKVVFPIAVSYSSIFIPYTLKPASRLLFVMEHAPLAGAAYLFCGVMNSAGSWKKQVQFSELQMDGKNYAWCVMELPESDFNMTKIGFSYGSAQALVGTDAFFDFIVSAEVEANAPISEGQVRAFIVSGGLNYEIHGVISDLYNRIPQAAEPSEPTEPTTGSSWQGRNVLFIGDSLTAAKQYPNTVKELLGINVFYHCKGGVDLLQMVDGDNGLGGNYDNETDAGGVLRPLSVEDVSGKDLIILYGGYNNRGTEEGAVGDCYKPDGSGQSTVAGYMQYCINRIYEELAEADNLGCRLLIVTVDCAGRYNYIDADGYEEWPAGSGRTMETMANIQKAVAEHNSLPCLDLWHNSGINRYTWTVFGASSQAEDPQYSPYRLNAQGDPESEERIRYSKGQSYYQIRDGAVVLEEYTASAPYPYNGDQLHKSEAGYRRIGECITGAILKV